MTILDVEYVGNLVGRALAEEDSDRFSFSYDPAWLARADTFPISANLPLRQAPCPSERRRGESSRRARRMSCDVVGCSIGTFGGGTHPDASSECW